MGERLSEKAKKNDGDKYENMRPENGNGERPNGGIGEEWPEMPSGEKPDWEWPEMPSGDKPNGEYGEKPDGEFPEGYGEKPDGEHPNGGQNGGPSDGSNGGP